MQLFQGIIDTCLNDTESDVFPMIHKTKKNLFFPLFRNLMIYFHRRQYLNNSLTFDLMCPVIPEADAIFR